MATAARAWIATVGFAVFALLFVGVMTAAAQSQTSTASQPPRASRQTAGFDIFGNAGVSWPSANDSFEAVGLNTTAFDYGGGVRATGLWGQVFLQVSGNYWSDDGERVFVDEEGNLFPLGIPLDVNATFIDGTVGVQYPMYSASGRLAYVGYVGGGAGVALYRERSPFATEEDDLTATKPSFHVMGGVEVTIARNLAVTGEVRYRYVHDLLNDGGVSAVFGESAFGGIGTSVGLRLSFGRRAPAPPPPPSREAAPAEKPPAAERPLEQRSGAVISEAAPVYLRPDASRTPLRTLPAGTSVRVLEVQGDWVRVEFQDAAYGRRVGYVQSRYVRVIQK